MDAPLPDLTMNYQAQLNSYEQLFKNTKVESLQFMTPASLFGFSDLERIKHIKYILHHLRKAFVFQDDISEDPELNLQMEELHRISHHIYVLNKQELQKWAPPPVVHVVESLKPGPKINETLDGDMLKVILKFTDFSKEVRRCCSYINFKLVDQK